LDESRPVPWIEAKAAWNAETLRGVYYGDLLILDEFQQMDRNIWTHVGAPMVIDNNGDAVFLVGEQQTTRHGYAHSEKMFLAAKAEMRRAAIEKRPSRWLAIG
jgi:hypothetical protein